MNTLAGQFPRTALCRVLSVARSTASYGSVRRPVRELLELKQAILALRNVHRGFQVRRMYALLKRQGIAASRGHVQRAYKELGILKKQASRKPRTTNSRHEHLAHPNLMLGLTVERPDQVWVADVTYLKVKGRFAYLALLMDVFTRRIVGWALSLANNTALTLSALTLALSLGRSAEIHHGDQGANYACDEYVRRLQARGTTVSMSAVGAPYENGYAERLNRTVKDEEVRLSDYRNMDEARIGLESFIERYNVARIHSSLAYKTPSEVFKEWVSLNG